MSETTDTAATGSAKANSTVRKPYRRPELADYGDVYTITQATNFVFGSDDGTGNNMTS